MTANLGDWEEETPQLQGDWEIEQEPQTQEEQPTYGQKIYQHIIEPAKTAFIDTTRAGVQLGIGAVQAPFIGYDVAAGGANALASTQSAQIANIRQNAYQDYEDLMTKKYADPDSWTEQDETKSKELQALYQKKPEELEKEIPLGASFDMTTTNFLNLIGDSVGVDFRPKNMFEKALRFTGSLTRFNPKAQDTITNSITRSAEKFTDPATAEFVGKAATNLPKVAGAMALNEEFGIPEIVGLTGIEMLLLGVKGAGIGYQYGKEYAREKGRQYFLYDPKKQSVKDFITNSEESMALKEQEALRQVEKGLMTQAEFDALKPYIDIAAKHGIPISPLQFTRSPYFKDVEKFILDNPMTQEEIVKFRNEAAESWSKASENSVEKMKTNLHYEEEGAVLDALKSKATTQLESNLEKEYTDAYDLAYLDLQNSQPISSENQNKIAQAFTNVFNKLRDTLTPTNAEVATKQAAKSGRRALFQTPAEMGQPGYAEELNVPGRRAAERQRISEAPNMKEVPSVMGPREIIEHRNAINQYAENNVKQQIEYITDGAMTLENGQAVFVKPMNGRNIIATVRSMNQKHDWDYPAVKNLLAEPRKVLKEVLEEEYSGPKYKKALDNYKKGNEAFGRKEEIFGKDARFKKWGINENTLPEELSNTLSTVDRMKEFEKTFAGSPGFDEMMDHLKYLKVKQKIADISNPNKYEPGQIANNLSKIQKDPMMKYMMPDEVKSNLAELEKLDRRLGQSGSKLLSSDLASTKHDNAITFLKIMKMVSPKSYIFSKGPELSEQMLSEVYSKILLDKDVTKRFLELGKKLDGKSIGKMSKEELNFLQNEASLIWNDLYLESNAIIKANMMR